jgi:superfamily II DNA or RNA helicase
MLARIVNNKIIKLEQISQAEENLIIKAFSVRNPKAMYIDMHGGSFDGWYRKYNSYRKVMSRALLGELREVCAVYRLPLTVVDDRPPAEYPAPDPNSITKDLLSGIQLYDHQMRAIKAACRAEVGLIDIKVGGGKTDVAAGIAKIMNCPTVIICDQTIVIEQIKARLELRKVAEEVGLFCAGKRPNNQLIVVGLIQSLDYPVQPPAKVEDDTPESYAKKIKAFETRRKNARVLQELVKKCDLLMVDEADKASGPQFSKLFRHWFNGRRRYGFSGTCFDPAKPVQNLVLKERLGSVIAKASRAELEAINQIIPVRYNMVVVGDPGMKYDRTVYDIAKKEQIIDNKEFHLKVAGIAKHASRNEGDGVLILVEDITLGTALQEIIPGSVFIYGNTNSENRWNAIHAFERREIKVLIGGKIIKRGLDLKGGCESLIIATGGKMWSDFDQKVGRAIRKNKRGFSYVYDFFMMGNKYLYEHSKSRLKNIVAMGYRANVVWGDKIITARQFIKSKYRMPSQKQLDAKLHISNS